MPGPKIQPIEVAQKSSRKDLTKAEIAKRKAREEAVKGETDKIVPPAHLTLKQKNEFKKLRDELLKIDIIQNLDVDTLALYIDTRTQYREVVVRIAEEAEHGMVGSKYYNSLQRTKDLLFSQCIRAANELGLTFTSRMKMAQPKKEEKPENKFAKFGT